MSEAGVETSNSKGQLKSIVDRYENLAGEIKGLQDDQKDILKEAAGAGFDVKVLRRVIQMRKQDPKKREEFETVLETYMHALDMLPS